MQKGTITVLEHTVKCENETGDTIDGDKLSVAIKEGKKTGILYRPGTGAEIGTWKIVNPEADELRKTCQELKEAMLWGDKMYKELVWEDESKDNLNYKIVNKEAADKWRQIASKLHWWLSTYIEAYPEHEGHQVYDTLKQYEQLCQQIKG